MMRQVKLNRQKPGPPAPDTPTDEKLFMFSAPFFKSSSTSSDVLDLLKDKQMKYHLPESYYRLQDDISHDYEKQISILQDLGEIARKTFEKVFPGETFSVDTGGGSLNYIVHEAGHIILDPSFNLKGLGDLQGTGTAIDHVYDELMNMIILTGDDGGKFHENEGINNLLHGVMKQKTYGEIFDFIENNTTRPEYKKYSNMLVSNLRNKYKDVLDNIPRSRKDTPDKSTPESVKLHTDIINYIASKFSKDPFIPGGDAREAAYKKWFRLFSKHVDEYVDKYESEESLKSIAAKIAGVIYLSADPDPGFTPELVPGFGFHLEGDGFWDIQEIPKAVLDQAKFSGYLEIEGFDSAVFDMPDGSQWAQKEPGLPAPKGDEAVQEILSFNLAAKSVSKLNLDPGIQRSLQAMAENMAEAEAALDQAVQHGRRLQMEPSFDWIFQQVQSTLEEFKEFRKSAVDSINYAL